MNRRIRKITFFTLSIALAWILALVGCTKEDQKPTGVSQSTQNILDVNFQFNPSNERSIEIKFPFKMKGEDFQFYFSLEKRDDAFNGNLNIRGQNFDHEKEALPDAEKDEVNGVD